VAGRLVESAEGYCLHRLASDVLVSVGGDTTEELRSAALIGPEQRKDLQRPLPHGLFRIVGHPVLDDRAGGVVGPDRGE
jgi:hypothetical protein